jgi:hypothetical protein
LARRVACPHLPDFKDLQRCNGSPVWVAEERDPHFNSLNAGDTD